MMKRILVAIAVVALALPVSAGEPIRATDLLRIRTVTEIDVARNGVRAVYVVRSIGAAEASEPDAAETARSEPDWVTRSHLSLVELEGSDAAPRRLTWGDRRDRSPRLSPDGRTIAFVRDHLGTPQLWLLPVDGGEARRVTSMQHGVSDPQWSPDGSRLLFAAAVPTAEIEGTPPWPHERWERAWRDTTGAPDPDGAPDEVRAWLAESAERGMAHVIARLQFQDEHELAGPMMITHQFVIDVPMSGPDTLDAGMLDPGPRDPGTNAAASPRQVTAGFVAHRQGRWLLDGASIVCVRQRDSSIHPDETDDQELLRVDVETGAVTPLFDEPGWRINDPQPSADGAVVAFTGRQTDAPSFRPNRLGVIALPSDVSAGVPAAPVWLTSEEGYDVSVQAFAWMPSRSALVFSAPVRGGFPLLTMGLGLLEPATVVDRADGQPIGVHAFGVGGGKIVYAVTHPRNPSVLRMRSARGDRLVEDLNPWLLEKDLAMPEEGVVERPDGTSVQYWVMEPPARAEGEPVPVVVQIHGGPHAMWGPGEQTMWHEFQLMCARGYAVAYANPRGSDGYGSAFRRANERNWGDGPGGDVLAMADEIAVRDGIDRDRMVVTGGSYGGYLTAWIVAHDHRFKAAVAQRGVYDLTTFFGEGNAWKLVPWEMGGYPWEPRVRAVLQRESPFTEVHRIRTPMLIMHASDDLRTGVSQSEMLYRGLRALGREVEYVRYPDAGHDLSRTGRPAQRLDRLNRIVEFFDRALD